MIISFLVRKSAVIPGVDAATRGERLSRPLAGPGEVRSENCAIQPRIEWRIHSQDFTIVDEKAGVIKRRRERSMIKGNNVPMESLRLL